MPLSDRMLIMTAGCSTETYDRPSLRNVVCAVLLSLPAAACGESYLDALQTEADKLGGIDAGGAETDRGSAAEDPRGALERELEERYQGSYTCYTKLPVKSREEVFLQYQDGASIEEVRKTILSRFLHSR